MSAERLQLCDNSLIEELQLVDRDHRAPSRNIQETIEPHHGTRCGKTAAVAHQQSRRVAGVQMRLDERDVAATERLDRVEEPIRLAGIHGAGYQFEVSAHGPLSVALAC